MGELFQKLDASQLVDDFADLPGVAGYVANPPGQEAHKPGLDRVRLWRAGGGVAGVGHQGRSSNPEQAVSLGFSASKSCLGESCSDRQPCKSPCRTASGACFWAESCDSPTSSSFRYFDHARRFHSTHVCGSPGATFFCARDQGQGQFDEHQHLDHPYEENPNVSAMKPSRMIK